MEYFRSLVRGSLGKVLLAIIILPFAFFGIEGIISSAGKAKPALVVGDRDFSKAEVDQAVEQQRQRFIQSLGASVDPSMISAELVKPQAIEALIQRELISRSLKQEKIVASMDRVKEQVRGMQAFHDEKGAFSQERLERLLAQNGYTAERFVSEVQVDLATEQFQAALAESAFALPAEIDALARLEAQKRAMSTVKVSADSQRDKIAVTDEQVKAFFDSSRDEFRTQERASFEYIVFGADDFPVADADITDADISAQYDKFVASMAGAEKRRASHILIETGDKRSDEDAKALAVSLLEKARAGADFADLATRNSEDTGSAKMGGDLGFAGKGVYDPAFESALFALPSVGEISEVVKSEFGYHVIKLLGIEGSQPPALADKRDVLISEIRSEKSKEKLSLAIDEINRLAFESGDLSVVAENYKKTVMVSDWVGRAGGADVFAEPEALKVAFSDAVIQEQRNSDVVELSDGRLLIVRLKEHEAARLQEFDEVVAQVKERALAKYALDKAQEVANAVLESVKAGKDATAILSEAGQSWENHEPLARTAATPDKVFIDKAFSLPKPSKDGKPSVASVALGTEGFGVVWLKSVDEPASDKTPEQRKQLGQGIAYRNGTLDFQAYLGTVRKETDIEINE